MSMPSQAMRRTWRREVVLMLAVLAAGAVAGLISGHVLVCVLLGVCAYLAMHLVYAYQLHRWLLSDRHEPSEGIGVWQEIYTELYRLKQRNRKRKKRLKRILDEFQASTAALPDGAVVLDAQGRIVWFNSAAGALLALRTPQDLGQRIANLLRHPRFSAALSQRRREIGELEIPSPASDTDTVLVRLIPYGNDQRLLIARDVSEQKRLEATRRDFVANASHELRTPLTVLRGYLEMMEEEAAGDGPLAEWRSPVTEMGEQARRMNSIIESLLKLARLEAEGLQQRQERIDVPAMIDDLADDIRRADDERHDITLHLDREVGLFGRPNELESIFSNLLANAVRYTPDGGPIAVHWWQDDQGAHFSVHDAGTGIEAQHIPRLTERFYRVDAGRKASDGGTGLGLAIVKHCLEHHEGELDIDSTPGEGSTFTCHFPLQRRLLQRAA